VPAPAPSGVAQLAAVAHAAFAPEIRRPVEVEAGDEAHLVRWLSTRLGRPVVVPRLDSVGLTLIGGRLLPTAPRGVAAQLMYEDRAGKRLTLYFKRPEAGLGETAFQFAEGRYGTSVFWWSDERFAYALVAALPREELLALARGVHEQLDR
jgi:anti-sigma factor RsiW